MKSIIERKKAQLLFSGFSKFVCDSSNGGIFELNVLKCAHMTMFVYISEGNY